MSKVVAIMSMSLDGYVGDLNDGVAELAASVHSEPPPRIQHVIATPPSSRGP